ncbi:MAG: hypothetical protein ACREU3_11360 [Steroidobacteraceae bacterium]
MQRNGVIALRPVFVWCSREAVGIEPEAAFGCVDWYPYPDARLAPCAAVREQAPGVDPSRLHKPAPNEADGAVPRLGV